MGEANPTPGPCYADGQVVHSDAVTCIAKFGDAYPNRRWSGSDFATEAHKEANAELFADALNVLTDTGLTPSQLVERVKELEEALSGLLEEVDLAGLGTAKDFGWPRVTSTARAALYKARPNTAEGEAHVPAPAMVAPEGWKLVPVKPTFAMIQAGLDKKNASVYVSRRVPRIYESMLNAAPLPPTAQVAPAAAKEPSP